jgi:hypothetical protein
MRRSDYTRETILKFVNKLTLTRGIFEELCGAFEKQFAIEPIKKSSSHAFQQ